jgi:hypothetical protein
MALQLRHNRHLGGAFSRRFRWNRDGRNPSGKCDPLTFSSRHDYLDVKN